VKSCLVITGGRLDLAFARSFLERERFDRIVAVDGGLEEAEALGLIPDYVVGDFDTVERSVRERFEKMPHIVWKCHRPEKNETDTELARSLVLTLGCGRVVFLGATGGRLDHMMANIDVLYACMQKGVEAWIVDSQNRLYLLDEGKTFCRDELWGKYVSFLPYTEQVFGITLTGFKYPLVKKNIRRGEEAGLCISNEVIEETGRITFDEGVVICVESQD